MNISKYITVFCLASFISSCTPDARSVLPRHIESNSYLEITCTELKRSKKLYLKRVRNFWELQDDVAVIDKVVVGVTFASFFILSPFLLLLSRDDFSKELANAKGKYLAIEKAYSMKNCDNN